MKMSGWFVGFMTGIVFYQLWLSITDKGVFIVSIALLLFASVVIYGYAISERTN